MQNPHRFPDDRAAVVIEVPRGAFVKRDAKGRIDLVSPIPAPFNYGRIEGHRGEDGDPLDVVVLGPRLPRGTRRSLPVHGVVHFVDGPTRDDKWVCGTHPPTRRQVTLVKSFFRVYAFLKRTRDRLHGQPATSRFAGWQSGTLS